MMTLNKLLILLVFFLVCSNLIFLGKYLGIKRENTDSNGRCDVVDYLIKEKRGQAINSFEDGVKKLGCLDAHNVMTEEGIFFVFAQLAEIYAEKGDCAGAKFCIRMARKAECGDGAAKYYGVDSVPEIGVSSRGTGDVGYVGKGKEFMDLGFSVDCDAAEEMIDRAEGKCE